jgi:predicted porin
MQKKIIALAIAAAISAPAFADTSNVTVYGKFDVSYNSINTGTSTAAAAGVTDRRLSSNTSLIGLKGSEDLGNGSSAIWQVESLVSPGAAGSTGTGLGGRNTFIGLNNADMGTVVMGRHDTPYKIATRAYDIFGDGVADNRSIMGGYNSNPAAGALAGSGAFGTAASSFDGRQDQVLAYISPKLADMVTLAVGYVNLNTLATANIAAGSNGAAVATNLGAFSGVQSAKVNVNGKNDAISAAAILGTGALTGSLAYEKHTLNAAAAGASEKATKLGLGYTMDAFVVGFAYEKIAGSTVGGLNAEDHNAYYLSGKYSFGSDAVKVAYTKAGNLNNVANTGAKQFSLGYDHSLTKRTTVYAMYSKISNDSAAGYMLSSNGTAGAASSAGLGASPSAVAFGLKHTF